MAKDDDIFLRPILKGERFKGGGIPLEVLDELQRYQEFIVDVAKHLFFEHHPKRKRAPRGFSDRLQLDLIDVSDDSSAVPSVRRVKRNRTEQPLPISDQDLFEMARDRINDYVRAAESEDAASNGIPKELLRRHFKRFGKSLKGDETISLTVPGATEPGPTVSRGLRREILSNLGTDYEEEIVISGRIVEVSTKTRRIRVDSAEFGTVRCDLPEHFEQTALQAHQQYRALGVCVIGTGVFKWDETLQSVRDITDIVDEPIGPDFQTRFDELEQLEDEWLDGSGKKPKGSLLDRVRDVLDKAVFQENTAAPFIFPMPDGGLQTEWELDERDVEIEFRPDNTIVALSEEFETNEWREKTFDLDERDLPRKLSRFVHPPTDDG